MLYTISLYFLYFLFYSAAGWVLEVIYCTLVNTKRNKKFSPTNRGFFGGPICPIYGFTAITMLITLSPLTNKPIVLALVGVVACDFVEYMTSFIMEKLFNARWWDYKNEFLNINGRICLKHSVMWTILSVVFMLYVHPFIKAHIFDIFEEREIEYIAIAALFLFVYDVVNTLITANYIRGIQGKIKRLYVSLGDRTPDIPFNKEKVSEYSAELREYISTLKHSRNKKRFHKILSQYPRLVELIANEVYELSDGPEETRNEIKFLQMDFDTLFNSDKEEMY